LERKKTIFIHAASRAYPLYLAIVLRKMGLEVTGPEEGEDVLAAVKSDMPDLIVLDADAPEHDAMADLRRLKADPQTEHIPVLVISSDDAEETEEECMELGASAYLGKPVNIRALHTVLQEHIYAALGYRRKHLRVLLYSRVKVAFQGVDHELSTETLSEGGIYICKDEPFPVGSEVTVTLPLGSAGPVSLGGRVIYSSASSGEGGIPQGMAVEFTDPDSQKIQAVADYITGLLSTPFIKSDDQPGS
jgi:CheY-like chemotaxis protein/Tfp pilus assembly protein PilZ